MADIYTRLRRTALRLLTKYGATSELVTFSDEGYDIATQERSLLTRSIVEVKAVVFPVNEGQTEGLVTGQTAFGFVAGSDTVVPKKGKHLVFNGDEYEILNVTTIGPNGTSVLFQLALTASENPIEGGG